MAGAESLASSLPSTTIAPPPSPPPPPPRVRCLVSLPSPSLTRASFRSQCSRQHRRAVAHPKLPIPKLGFPSSRNSSLQVIHAAPVDNTSAPSASPSGDGTRWWQKGNEPNLRDINSTQEFLEALSNAGEKLVVVEFFASWCGSCKALYPKLCQLAAEYPNVDFLKVNFDENKAMCKSLNVKVLPFFHFYRGADGRLDSFSCSLSKLVKLKEALAKHNTDRCSIGPPVGLSEEEMKLLGTSPQVAAGSAA